MRNIIKILILICIVMALNMVNLSCVLCQNQSNDRILSGEMNLPEHTWGKRSQLGYKPVPDVSQYEKLTSRQSGDSYHGNFLYKNWCDETFDNGNYIYEAYKNIAFNIKYTSEPNKTDFWQTPIETDRLKKGDCEDAVFLLFSQLPSNQENAEIVWGWIVDKQSKVTRPHVWYQLIDKKGQKYIVEGFSKDWNGIIPMEIAKEYESRKPILTVPHTKVIELVSLLLEANDRQAYGSLINLLRPTNFSNIDFDNWNHLLKTKTRPHHFNYEFSGYMNTQDKSGNSASHRVPPKMRKEIFNIFRKLRVMFLRYDKQKV